MDFKALSKKIDWSKVNNRELVVCDLETTGFSEKSDKIIEIGCVRMKPEYDNPTVYNALINIDEPLSDEIIELTGITDELLKSEGVKFYRAIGGFKTFLGTSDAAAYNSKFDKKFLDQICKQYNIPFTNYMPDVMITCIKAFKLKGKKLSDVADFLGVSSDGAHRAVADCKVTLYCLMSATIALQNTHAKDGG